METSPRYLQGSEPSRPDPKGRRGTSLQLPAAFASAARSALGHLLARPYPDPGAAIRRLLPALAVHSWGLQQLPVLGSPGSASRKLVPFMHPLDSQLLCRSKKPLAALSYGSPSQAASGVAVLPIVLLACLILPLGTFPTQVRARREEAASQRDLQLQLPSKPLQWQCIKGAGQGTKSIDSEECIQLHLIYFRFLTGQRWQWQSIFFPLYYMCNARLRNASLFPFLFLSGKGSCTLPGLSFGRFTYRLCTFGEKRCLGLDLRNIELAKCGRFPACNCIIL